MTKSFFLLVVQATIIPLLGGPHSMTPAIQTSPRDSLSAYAYCQFTGPLSVASVDRMPGRGLRYRTVETSAGPKKISMVDGYRVMLAHPGGTYFANMHVEESGTSQYLADKDAAIRNLETIAAPSGAPMVTDHRDYNGFDMYAADDPTLKGNGPSGMYLLFRDSAHLIVTIYFLAQRPEDWQFKTIDQYNALRDFVLKNFTTCASEAPARVRDREIRLAELLSGNHLVDSFDSVSQWSTNPSAGVEITIHPDSGAHGRGMRVDFDFHGHGGYGIVHRQLELELPANYEFAFAIRGAAPSNTLEFKLVDPTGASVWWSNNPNFAFPREWRTIARKKRQICFAWGPARGADIRRLAAIEFAVTAGNGGKGSVWIDDLSLNPLEADSPFDVIAPMSSVPIVGTWESRAQIAGGLASTLEFAADGSLAMTVGGIGDFSYTVVDNRLTTTFKDLQTGKNDVRENPFRIEHDTLIQKDGNGPGKNVVMKRVGRVNQGESILGVWRYEDDMRTTSFVEFAPNGRGQMRLPINSCSGSWKDSGQGRLNVSIAVPIPTIWNYSIQNGVITMRYGDGPSLTYTRRTPRW